MRLASTKRARPVFPRLTFDLQEWSGALGDLGLLIPIVAALVLTNGFNATSVLLVFGVAYILSALYYLPQPTMEEAQRMRKSESKARWRF